MGFIISLRQLREFNAPGCVLAFLKESAGASVTESVNEERAAPAIKETTEALVYRVNSLGVGEKLSPGSRKATTVYLEEEVQHCCLVAEGA